MTFRKKIDNILEASGLKMYQLEDQAGFGRGTIQKRYHDDKGLSPVYLKIFLKELGIDKTWWETGKGEIFEGNNTRVLIANEQLALYNARPVEDLDIIPVRIVEAKAQAGYMRGYADTEYVETLPIIYVNRDGEHKGKFMAFTVSGDSMDDGTRRALCHGDIVLGKELQQHHWKNKLHFNQYLFIIVHEEGVMFKQITAHNPETGDFTCHSFNSEYEDFILNINEVKQLFYIKKIVERSIKF